MLTIVIIVLLGLALFAYVALPLINPQGADPLPPQSDPLLTDLEEEKEALFRAIRELDQREDLSPERREQLRVRYEAKAAKVLRSLDERRIAGVKSASGSAPGSASGGSGRRRALPVGTLVLLGAFVIIGTTMGAWVLPRVGQGTVTTFFQQDLDVAQALRDAERAVERDPSGENLLALGDIHWQMGNAQAALDSYGRAVQEAGVDDDATALRRLGFLTLQTDLVTGLDYLERAQELDPGDLDTLYAIGEVNFALGNLDAAVEAWRQYLATDEGANDPEVLSRVELVEEIRPLDEAVARNPSEENLLALADTLWRFDERSRAVEVYFRVLTQHDPNDAVALGRTGQLMFLSGRNDDAVMLMERAAQSEGVEPETLLFLGNAHFSAGQYEEAIDAWERHVAMVGEDAAGRVPSLIADARARLEGEAGAATADTGPAGEAGTTAADSGVSTAADAAGEAGTTAADAGASGQLDGGESDPAGSQDGTAVATSASGGAQVFAANCSACHGPQGQGGVGPRLAGNSRAGNEANVRSAVRFGRGMMPAFQATLSPEEIDAVVDFVVTELAVQTAQR